MRSNFNSSVIVAAKRTAIGSFGGSLSYLAAHKLGATCMMDIIKKKEIDPKLIDEVIIGQNLCAGEGQNPARQASLLANIGHEVPAVSINKLCGSGMKAIHYGIQSICIGDSNVVLAGGQESMSMAPHLLPSSRIGRRMGNWSMVDSMLNDSLTCAFGNYHMGVTAENIAQKYNISREDQDKYAFDSQKKASKAQELGIFKEEIVDLQLKQSSSESNYFSNDEHIRHDITANSLASLTPAFIKDGSVTAGNAAGINDGAAMLLLMSESFANKLNIEPLARVVSWAVAGVDPAIMGMGPVPASKKCLKKAGWGVDDLDVVESNEAFAAQALAVNKEMGWDSDKVNINGGAIALGHPVGASGARILTSLLYQMKRSSAKKGLATMCIGGGQGIALTVES